MRIKDERAELEKMIQKSPESLGGDASAGTEVLGLQAPIMDIDFDELKKTCEEEAKAMILNSVHFSLPEEMITGNEYLKNKIEIDSLSLSGMVYQLRINEIMQRSLVEQVNSGMINARMWEVFGQLSKTIGDLNKQLIQTVEAIQSTYKNMKDMIKEKQTEALGPTPNRDGMLTTGDGGVVTRGTKELINNVKRIKQERGFLDEANLVPDLPVDGSVS